MINALETGFYFSVVDLFSWSTVDMVRTMAVSISICFTFTLCRFVCVEKAPPGREVILFEDKSLRKIINQENYYKVEHFQ